MPNPSLSKADQKNVWSAKVMVKKENSVVCQIFYKRRQSRKILNIQKKNCAKEIKKILLDWRYLIFEIFIFAPEQQAEIVCRPSLSFAIILAKYLFLIN